MSIDETANPLSPSPPTDASMSASISVSRGLAGAPASRSATARRAARRCGKPLAGARRDFRADDYGVVDVDAQQPLAGTTIVSTAMGLFWSMALDPATPRISSFRKTTMSPLTTTVRASTVEHTLAEATIERLVLDPTVDRIVVRDSGLAGTLFIPKQGGPYPGLIVLGGSGGGIWEAPAPLLAAHGFATLALAYFAYEHLPAQLSNIPLDYFETALTWLRHSHRSTPNGWG